METDTEDGTPEADLKLFQGTLFNPPETQFRRCPKRAVPVWRIEAALGLGMLTLGISLALFLIVVLWQKQSPWWLLMSLALTVPLYLWSFFRAPTKWRMTGYYLGPQELWTREGLGHRTMTTAPYGRIQECVVSTTFWGRRFRLANVSVSIGGGDSLSMYDIEPEEAEKVAALLRDLALKRGVQL